MVSMMQHIRLANVDSFLIGILISPSQKSWVTNFPSFSLLLMSYEIYYLPSISFSHLPAVNCPNEISLDPEERFKLSTGVSSKFQPSAALWCNAENSFENFKIFSRIFMRVQAVDYSAEFFEGSNPYWISPMIKIEFIIVDVNTTEDQIQPKLLTR